jgi:hypothetical protein
MRIPILLLTVFFSLTLFAQKRSRDVVYLKNGSIIKGTIVLQDPGKQIKLKTKDNNLWVFRYDEIDSITRPSSVVIPFRNGYFNLTELGVLAGNSSNATRAPFTMTNINSWYFPKGYSAGLGVGVELSNETYLPVVADFRYYLQDRRPLPFISLQAGYSFALGGSYTQTIYAVDDIRLSPMIWPGPVPSYTNDPISARGGILINPSIGIQTPINERFALTFSAGYRWMRHSYGRTEDYRIDIDYRRLTIKIGLLFK